LPFCIYLGITNSSSKYEPNQICEKVFKEITTNPNKAQVEGLTKQLEWSQQRVERWFRKRRKANQLPLLKKATESCWRCIFYFWLFCFGAYTILPTEWFYDTRKWMIGYIREVYCCISICSKFLPMQKNLYLIYLKYPYY